MIYEKINKPLILYKGIYNNHKICIISLGSHPTAYVECKFENCNNEFDKRLNLICVHGGFTYVGDPYWSDIDSSRYIGWDYSHFNDYTLHLNTLYKPLKKWTTIEIYEEVKYVINQLINIENKLDYLNMEVV